MRFLFLLTLALWSSNIQSQKTTTLPASSDRAIVTPKRVERVIGRGEDAWTDVVITPVVTGLTNTILKPIQKELRLERVMGKGEYELFRKKHVGSLDYGVTYNRDHILGLTFNWMFWGSIERTVTFDLTNGRLINLSDLILEDRMEELASLVSDRLQNEIRGMIRDYKGGGDIEETIKRELRKVTKDDLSDFSINGKGITLFFHAGFHHVSSWAEPKGRYFFTYDELKPFLRPHTPISQFLN